MSVTWDELVELHAEATWSARLGGFTTWSDLSERVKEIEREASRAALSAIREAGVRLMPAEATEEMIGACYEREMSVRARIGYGEAYAAMLAAGEIKPGEKP